ncbi:MAG: substrate-binding domain-containing protein, partial [Gemmatimonadaceae bacterium]|nr:substrate-binding domain-containing protein [Acetobacteraceae bacterium]
AALNPGLTLPDAAITVLRRSDGSGTTFAFTEFLSSASADWRGQLGSGLTVAWPVGSAAKGNDGMADAMRRTANAIGYVDFAQARRAGLTATLVRNRANVFVGPSVESFRAAADSAGLGSSTANVSLTNMAGEGSYPIVATTYAVMRSRPNTTRGGRDTIEFFRWAFDNGAPAASELGYVALPASLVAKVKEYWLTAF